MLTNQKAVSFKNTACKCNNHLCILFLKELAQQITDHKSELDNMVHHGKVAEYSGPAGEADSQPTKPHSHYSLAIKRYEIAEVTCQECASQLEETLNKISEVTESIKQLILVLNDHQVNISKTGQFRVKSVDAKEQLMCVQVKWPYKFINVVRAFVATSKLL